MSKKQILGGIGVGVAVGAAVSMAMAPRHRFFKRSTTGKAIKAVSQMMDHIVDAIGM